MTIRKATANDADAIASCLLLAMEDLVYQFIGEANALKAHRFLAHFAGLENNQYSYQNCWVAENETGVIAAANVYDGAILHALRKPVLEHLQRVYQFNLNLEDETGAGEYYLDSLGVLPDKQGTGIGTTLLQFLIETYVHQQPLGLLVDEENPAARRLYEKLGFQPVGTKQLLGKQMAHLQYSAKPTGYYRLVKNAHSPDMGI